MHIAIDYTAAVRQGAGIGRYTRSLIRALAGLDADNQYTLFVAGGWGAGDGQRPWPENFRIRGVPLTDRLLSILWQRLRIPVPIQAITGRIDLFHSPDFVLPPTGRTPAVLTVHDLSFLRVPQYFVPGFGDYLEVAVTRAVKQAQHILADSRSTRHDLVELLKVEPTRVSVIYPGVEARFAQITDAYALRSVTDRYQLPENFVLGLGTLQPRKNFEGLIKAFGALVSGSAGTERFSDLHLVIGGGSGWMDQEILQTVNRCGLQERVRLVGFVRDQDLPALYTLASVFAFPSWYEGFGLPILEAQACGTPVVAANNSSLPEVVGDDGGLLVDAADIDELSHALFLALTDPVRRAELISAGLKQAARFRWETAARQLFDVYQRFGTVGANGEW